MQTPCPGWSLLSISPPGVGQHTPADFSGAFHLSLLLAMHPTQEQQRQHWDQDGDEGELALVQQQEEEEEEQDEGGLALMQQQEEEEQDEGELAVDHQLQRPV